MSEAAAEDGIRLVVRVTPKGGQDALEGFMPDANGKLMLKARIAATTEAGKANASLVTLLSKEFAVPKGAVTIMRGAAARLKQVRIRGDSRRLVARLREIGGGA